MWVHFLWCSELVKMVYSQVDMPTQGQGSTLVSMFRGMGIEPPIAACGRGGPPVGECLRSLELS